MSKIEICGENVVSLLLYIRSKRKVKLDNL